METVRSHLKEEKNEETFLKLVHILGMLKEIVFKFEMWLPLSEGYLHCKLGAIRVRHNGATYAGNS